MDISEYLVKEQCIAVNALELEARIQFYELRQVKHLSLKFLF